MAKFPTYKEIAKKAAEEALDGYIYQGKTLREWVKIVDQWQELKETIIELRDSDGTGTQQEICKFLVNYMDVLEKNVSGSKDPNKWIPVSERPPEESGKYLVTFGGTYLVGKDFYNTEEDARRDFEEPEKYMGWSSNNVIAWKPLPEPYKEGDEE